MSYEQKQIRDDLKFELSKEYHVNLDFYAQLHISFKGENKVYFFLNEC